MSVSGILKSTSVLSYRGCLRRGGGHMRRLHLGKRSNQPLASTSTLWPLRKSMQPHLLNARGSWSWATFFFSQFAANPTSPMLGFPINKHPSHLHPHFSDIRVCGPAVSRHFILPSKCKWERILNIAVPLCVLTNHPFRCNCQQNICAN